MSAYFQKGYPNVRHSSVQIQGKGLASLQYGTLLRPPIRARVRWAIHAYPTTPAPMTVSLCISRNMSWSDTHPDMPRLRHLALTSAQSGHYEEAIATFDMLLTMCPESAVDYNNRGLVHFQAGNIDQAIADYNQALELNPCLDSAYNNRANYYAAKGNFLAAILDYDVALELNPDNIRAWINQGITFRDLRMYNRALENFAAALKFNRLQGHIYAEQGRTHHLSGDWNWAIADYQRALELLEVDEGVSGHLKRLKRQIERWINELLCNVEM